MPTVEIFANFVSFWCDNMFLVYLYTQKICASLCTKFAPALETPFLQAAMAPSSGKWYLDTAFWALGVLIAVGLAIVSQLFHWTKLEYIF